MAQLFLSYSRKDGAKARRFCDWLEREGHEVWRDDEDIGGGASFSMEIEKALSECDAVVVLWSAESVQSAWVRDEAGFGRDAGKLIPISLDGIGAPLGFRQFQSIDLSKWKGHGAPAAADRVSNAIARIAGSPPKPVPPVNGQEKSAGIISRPLLTAALAAFVVAVAIGCFFLWRSFGKGQAITIAVMASPTSPDHATATDYANITAADMAAFLPTHFDRATVIAPADATNSGTGYRMLISANPHGGEADASLTLSDIGGSTILWSKSWSVPGVSAVDLRQEISRSASQATLCLTEAKGGREQLVQPALGVFLSGCVETGESASSDAELLAAFERVVKLAPKFPRGWAYLAVARAVTAEDQGESPAAIKSARDAISTARKLNPRSGLAYLAESILVPNDRSQTLALLDKGAELEPDNALLQTQRVDILRSFGRMADSLQAAKRGRT